MGIFVSRVALACLVLVGVGLAVTGSAILAATYTPERVGPDGARAVAMTDDGNFVAFAADGDAFLYDRTEETTQSINVTPEGGAFDLVDLANGSTISADGRYVAFQGTVLDTEDQQVYVRDVVGETTTLVSPDFQFADDIRISADGTVVAFLGDQGEGRGLFIRDLVEETTTEVALGLGISDFLELSADGRYLVFTSNDEEVVPEGSGGFEHALVYDRDPEAPTTLQIANLDEGGERGPNGIASSSVAMSNDGRFVAFSSVDPLVEADANGTVDAYVRDLVDGTTELVSVSSDGELSADGSFVDIEDLSATGQYVVFNTDGADLVPDDGNGGEVSDIFVREREGGTTELWVPGPSVSEATISSDGDTLALASGRPLIDGESEGGVYVVTRTEDGGGGEPQTYTVNANGDPGEGVCDAETCTLREAIDAANGDGVSSTILFDLGGFATISPDSLLPELSAPVHIDGTNLGGGGPVVIDASGVGSGGQALQLGSGSDGSTVENLDIFGLDLIGGVGIRVLSSNNTIRANDIFDTEDGIILEGANNTIGGSFPAGDGNRIWDFAGYAIHVDIAGPGNQIAGNTIGIDADGTPQLQGGQAGIFVGETAGLVIGHDVNPGELHLVDGSRANVIVQTATGIMFESEVTGARVAGNVIGTDRARTATSLGNFQRGIDVTGGSDNNQLGPGNEVAYNGHSATGIVVAHSDGNRIVANSIHDNIGLGISLNSANGNLEAPTLTAAVPGAGGTATVSGSIEGPTGDYYVEFFKNDACDPSTFGEGETYVGFAQASISEIGASFSGSTFPGVAAGDVLTATLTGASTNNTSEFSNCVTVTAAGEGRSPVVLFGAVPNAVGATLGVAGVWESGSSESGQTFDVSFFSVPTCDPSAPKALLGSGNALVTNERGVGAFAIDGLTNVAVGTLIAATVSFGEETTPLSNCVVADRMNTSWPTALELAAADTEPGHLRSMGQGRWFKVPILPNSRVDVNLSNLPADYDLVVFKDIEAKYEELVGGAAPEAGPNLALDDLNRQGADTPVDVFNTSQYNPSSWDPTNWKPDLNANLFSPAFSPTEYSPTEYSAAFTSPTEYSPTEYSPTEYSPTEYSADQFSRDEWATFNPADPRAFSAAQTASVLAVSSGPGTGDESVSVNTWNNTGHFYIRVQGKNGSFDPDTPFSLRVSTQGDLCSGVVDQTSTPTATAGGYETLILVDSNRLPGLAAISDKLDTLAERVDGVVVDVHSDSAVSGLNTQADSKPGCPFAKNLVASATKRIVDAYRDANPTLKYLVVVGDDDVIPFFRYPDPALLGNERLYVPPVVDNSASQASLRLGYVLSDDFLASRTSVSIHGNAFPVPDLAIGRLVETPGEIEGLIDAYLGTSGGVVPTPTSSLVTGYDFLTDAADEIAGDLATAIPGGNNERLITNQGVSPATVTVGTTPDRTHSWTATDLRRELLNQRHDVIFLAGHFSANDALAADYRTNVLSTELPGATVNLENAIVFSAGCHAAYNIVDDHATPVTEELDWVQAFARKKATLIAGTGYQYGDTDFLAHSERIYAEFARQLGGPETRGVGAVAVGSALLRSKQVFLEETPGLSALDEKALLEATLFGLPMLSVDLPGFTPPDNESSVVSPTEVEGGPGEDLDLQVADVSVPGPSGAPQPKTLNGLGADNPATWLEGSDGVAVKPMQPVLPLESLNVTAGGRALRGVGFRQGSYTDTAGTVPLTAAPATELRGIHAPFSTDVFFPPQPWTANYFGALGGSGNTQLHVTPVQHRSESPQMTRRTFTGMNFSLFYSEHVDSFCGNRDTPAPCSPGQIAVTPALAAPPTITGVDTSFEGGVLTISAHVLGDPVAGIQEVWVTYTNPPEGSGPGTWQSIDLEQADDDPTIWEASLTIADPGSIVFMVQAVNGVGKVTLDNNLGSFYRHGSIPGPLDPDADPPTPTTLAFTSGPPGSVAYKQSFDVTVTLSSSPGCTVGERRVNIALGGAGLPATTNAGGQATVRLTPALTPGTYPVTASFAGTNACGASDASTNIVVTKQPTSLAIAFPFVTLTAATTPQPTPLHDRTVIITVVQGATTRLTVVGRTDPQGRVRVPPSLLGALPQASYTVRAEFAGDEGYAAAVASAANGLNVIRRGTGSDRITGTNGSDLIIDSGGSNTIDARDGNDVVISLGNGSQTILGGAGDDWIETGSGSDKIDSGAGNDTIHAGDGSNEVTAGSGDDFITAGTGSDKVNGGAGFDVCRAGGGSNTVTNCEA